MYQKRNEHGWTETLEGLRAQVGCECGCDAMPVNADAMRRL